MASKSKSKAERAVEELVANQRKQLIDEFGRLDAELSPHKGKQRRMEELARIIRSWHAGSDLEATVSSAGDEYEVVLSAASMQTHISDMAEVYKLLGRQKFIEISSVTLKSLEQAVDSAAYASLTRKERTGSRTIVVRSLG